MSAPITAKITDSTGIHYKHYSQEAGGIDRAMKELYPLLDDSIISSLVFIHEAGRYPRRPMTTDDLLSAMSKEG